MLVASEQLSEEFKQDQQALQQRLQQIVEQRSEKLVRWKRPTKVIVLTQDLPRSTTRKIKRLQVEQIIEQHVNQYNQQQESSL